MIDVLLDFFSSELAKDYKWILIVTAGILFILGNITMWVYMEKIHMKRILNRNEELEENVHKMKQREDALREELDRVVKNRDELLEISNKLSFRDKMMRRECALERNEIDAAIKTFIKD